MADHSLLSSRPSTIARLARYGTGAGTHLPTCTALELFKPFILYNEHDFVADNVEKLAHALVAEERADFGYDTRRLDWWDYWINVHIPALRRWTYPLMEGRPLEARPPRNFSMQPEPEHSASTAPASSPHPIHSATDGASWQYS